MISRADLNPAAPRDLPKPRPIRARVNAEQSSRERLADLLQPITSILAAVFLLLAGYKMWAENPPSLLQRLAAGNGFLFLLLRLMIGHFTWTTRVPHFTATLALALTVTYSMAAIWLTGALWSTTYLAFTIIFMGVLYASRTWLYATAICISGWWSWGAFSQMPSEPWMAMAGTLLGANIAAVCVFELRRKTMREEHMSGALILPPPDSVQTQNASDRVPSWCPVCKASTDAIVRHDGEMVIDANPAATSLLGMSVSELAILPVTGLFSIEKRDALKPFLRLGNFEPFETLAAGFKDELIPVKILNSGPAGERPALQALVMRDLREIEKLRLGAAAANRRSQQAFCRNRELAGLARKQSRQTVEAKLKSLAQNVHRWLPCSVGCFIVLWDNAAEQFSVAAASAANALDAPALLAGDAPLINWLAEHGEALVVPKVAEDQFAIRTLYSSEPVNSFCAFPLMTEDGMMGFLLVLDHNAREFASEELDYLTVVSQLATNACDRAMLEERLHAI